MIPISYELAEEVEEEHAQQEEALEAPVPIPSHTKEMDEAKETEERLWKEENLMTERDLTIASTDLPERMQLLGGPSLYMCMTCRYSSHG